MGGERSRSLADQSEVLAFGEIRAFGEMLAFGETPALAARRTVRYRCARFALAGAIDDRTEPWLTQLLTAACADPDVDVVVVDLRRVTFLGAAGVRCFNRTAEISLDHRARLSLWDPSPFVRRTLGVGGLHPSILLEPEIRDDVVDGPSCR